MIAIIGMISRAIIIRRSQTSIANKSLCLGLRIELPTIFTSIYNIFTNSKYLCQLVYMKKGFFIASLD
ncbi:MAG: hypothetical protein EBS72_12820, partial [Rhizobiales bacterium]|nr:hypothetical protein [Hyphomicrobiales bacterium]